MHWLREKAERFGGRVSIVEGGRRYSYGDLAAEIGRMHGVLDQNGVAAGEVVALLSDYSFRGIALFMALLERKAVIMPITVTTPAEVEVRLSDGSADRSVRVLPETLEFVSHETPARKHGLIERLRSEGSAGLILFSSGSTGKPKAMVHNLDNLDSVYRDRKEKALNILVFLMFDHIGGLNTMFNALSMGATLVIPPSRDVDVVCGLIEAHRVALLPASPTFLNLMLIGEAPGRFDLGSLRMITYGTEAMPEGLLGRLKAAFPKAKFLQTFGTSETGIAKTSSKSSTSTAIRIDDENTEYRIVEGELWLRSKTQIMGYLNATSEAFTEDGWFKTGDLVEDAGEGYLQIKGRSKEIINVGGEKVLPSEVESVLHQMPEVRDCMVYAESSPIVGQVVAADVMLAAGVNPKAARAAIRKFCRERLDGYKVPVKINVVEAVGVGDRFKKMRLMRQDGVRPKP